MNRKTETVEVSSDIEYVLSDFARMFSLWYDLDLVDKAVTFQIVAWERCGDHVNCVMVPRSYFATAQPATAVECVLAPVSFTQPDVEAIGAPWRNSCSENDENEEFPFLDLV